MTNATPAPIGADAALALLVAAVEAETDPSWECNSYHPSLWSALDVARAALASAAQPHEAVQRAAAVISKGGEVQRLEAPAARNAAERDALLQAAIDFIGTLTGMTPPPIEVAPPEVFAPFRAFVDRVQAITNEYSQPAPAAQGDALPREDFAWMVVQEACETEPADEDDPECIRILRRDLKSAVLAAFLREAAARAAKEGDRHG